MNKSLSLAELVKDFIPLLQQHASRNNVITEDTVHRQENPHIRAAISSLIGNLLLEGSQMYPAAHLESFLEQLNQGKKGIILAEHYSNLDLPILLYLMEQTGEKGKELSKKVIAMAGMKLTEENPYIAALSEGYERIVIYPSRTLAGITDPERLLEEEKRSRSINLASMKALEEARKAGNAVLVFPAGTRYRPGKPETKRGVREIDSYIRSSDIMLLISINGNCLRISDDPANMLGDIICQDRIVMEVSPVLDCSAFRAQAKQHCPDTADKKQVVVDMVMHELEAMHNRNEAAQN